MRVVGAVVAAVVGVGLLVGCTATPDHTGRPSTSTTSAAAAAGTSPPAPEGSSALAGRSVVLFTRTTGYRHDSIEPATTALQRELTDAGAEVSATDDAAVLVDGLDDTDVVVFLSTTGELLDDPQQDALQAWVEGGGRWAGIHAAFDAEYEWPFYEQLLGSWFHSHPAAQPGAVVVEDGDHPAARDVPARWVRTDEWYDVRRNPRGDVHVILTVDESTYEGATMGADHPIAWCDQVGQGRTFVTAMGHTVESWADPTFLDHVVGGIAALEDPASCA